MRSSSEDVKDRTNIVDIVGEYVKLEKAGANWKARCPFHNEKSPSFMVNEEKQIWHCFGCSKGGDVYSFVMEMEGLEFRDALKILADKAGVPLADFNPQKSDNKKRLKEILELATKFYEKQLWDGTGKEKILEYLHSRGIGDEAIKLYRLGYAPPGWRNVLEFLTGRGYATDDIASTGLLVESKKEQNKENKDNYYDRFRDRIIFPIADVMSEVIGYSARVAPGGDESQAKYVNTPETTLYNKSRVLYGIDLAKHSIKQRNFSLLVEGNLDVIAASQAGIPNTAAVSGTALTQDQVKILSRYSNLIKLYFDTDDAGKSATVKSAKLCYELGMEVEIVQVAGAKDAAEVAMKNSKQLEQAVSESTVAMDYFLDEIFQKYDKTKASEKKKIANELIDIIESISDEIERSHWLKVLAEKLDVDERILTNRLKGNSKTHAPTSTTKEEDVEKDLVRNRSDMIRDRMAALALTDKKLWEFLASHNLSGGTPEAKFDLMDTVINFGADCDYKFEKLLTALEDENLKAKIQNAYFNEKYTTGEKDKESGAQNNSKEDMKNLIKEYEREIKKEKMRTINRDLKKAEEVGDKASVKILVEEFSKIADNNDE